MKNTKAIALLAAFMLMIATGCNKDPVEVLVGTWSVSDGGTATFNADGTAIVSGSEEFQDWFGGGGGTDPDTLNWRIITKEENGTASDNLEMDCVGPCTYSGGNIPIKVKSKNKIQLQVDALLFDFRFYLDRQ